MGLWSFGANAQGWQIPPDGRLDYDSLFQARPVEPQNIDNEGIIQTFGMKGVFYRTNQQDEYPDRMPRNNPYWIAQRKQLVGVIDTSGREIIPCQYREIVQSRIQPSRFLAMLPNTDPRWAILFDGNGKPLLEIPRSSLKTTYGTASLEQEIFEASGLLCFSEDGDGYNWLSADGRWVLPAFHPALGILREGYVLAPLGNSGSFSLDKQSAALFNFAGEQLTDPIYLDPVLGDWETATILAKANIPYNPPPIPQPEPSKHPSGKGYLWMRHNERGETYAWKDGHLEIFNRQGERVARLPYDNPNQKFELLTAEHGGVYMDNSSGRRFFTGIPLDFNKKPLGESGFYFATDWLLCNASDPSKSIRLDTKKPLELPKGCTRLSLNGIPPLSGYISARGENGSVCLLHPDGTELAPMGSTEIVVMDETISYRMDGSYWVAYRENGKVITSKFLHFVNPLIYKHTRQITQSPINSSRFRFTAIRVGGKWGIFSWK